MAKTEDETDGKAPGGRRGYASPPCFMHEIDPAYGGVEVVDADQARDVARWRKAERKRLIGDRLALTGEQRTAADAAIAEQLDRLVPADPGTVVAVYWPFRGEPDPRPWMKRLIARGGRITLPVVVDKASPLVFRAWRPGDRLERGVWNIPVPAAGPEVAPDFVVSPVVGFDRQCYRLGNGGGFYDRTLAALQPWPRVIGIGYPFVEIATIYPQPHDIPMDVIVTGGEPPIHRVDA